MGVLGICTRFYRGILTVPIIGNEGASGRGFTKTRTACAVRDLVRSNGTLRSNADRGFNSNFTGTFKVRCASGGGRLTCIRRAS